MAYLLGCENVQLEYPTARLFDSLTLGVNSGDRIGIVGRNGAGKSTLLRLIAGELTPDSGTVELGETVRIGHFSQEGRELDLNQKVFDFIYGIAHEVKTDEGTFSAKTMLERFLFTPDLQQTVIGRLSGGERRRVYLLSVLMAAPNVLLLDEPTNDLDLETLNILEDYLDGFQGAIVAVSHDRYFLDRVTRKLFALEDGELVPYIGGYEDYLADKAAKENAAAPKAEKPAPAQPVREKTPAKRFTFKEQRDFDTIDGVIAELEAKLEQLAKDMDANSADYAKVTELMAAQEKTQAELDAAMERWMYLQERYEEIQAAKEQKT